MAILKPRKGRRRLYDLETLACYPIEHAIEELSCRELAQVLDIKRDEAHRLKRGLRDGVYQYSERQSYLLRRWLNQVTA